MRGAWLAGGILLLSLGLVWIVSILGGVFSQAQGYTNLFDLWGGLAFHTLCMVFGMLCMAKASQAKKVAVVSWGGPTRMAP